MNAAFDDERLSGYLDGELPPSEREELTARLAEDGELRQALEELRALSAAMQGLPRHRLDESFSSEVMRRAEIEMLTGNSAQASSVSAAPRKPAASSGVPETAKGSGLRPLLWVAATVALAAVIWKQFDNRREREVARGPAKDEVSKNEPFATAKPAAGHSEQPDFGAPPPADLAAQSGTGKPASTTASASPRDEETGAAFRRAPLAMKAPDGDVERSTQKSEIESRKAGGDVRAEATLADAVADGRKGVVEAAKGRALAEVAAGQPAQAAVNQAAVNQAAVDQLAVTLTSSDAIVVCEITPEAASGGLVYQLLASQAIDPAEDLDANSRGGEEPKAAAAEFKDEARRSVADRAAPEPSQANDLAKAAMKKRRTDDMGGTDLLEIEATPEQIVGLLAAMRQRPSAVTAIHELQRANAGLAGNAIDKRDRGGATPKFAKGAESEERITENKQKIDRRSRTRIGQSRESAPGAAPAAVPAPAERSKAREPAPATKSGTVEEALPADDAPAETSPKPSKTPARSGAATDEADAAPASPRSADVKARSRGESRSVNPSGPAAVQRDKSKSETLEKENAETQGAKNVAGRRALDRGVYRKLTIQPEPAKPRDGFSRGQDRNESAKAHDGEPPRRRFIEQKADADASPAGITRQRIVLLIQVRPPVAAAPAAGEPVPVPAPAAEPASK